MDNLKSFSGLPVTEEVECENTIQTTCTEPKPTKKNDSWADVVEGYVAKSFDTFIAESRKTGNIFQGLDAVIENSPAKIVDALLYVHNSIQEEKGNPSTDRSSFVELCKEQLLADPVVASALDSQGTMTGSILKSAIKKLKL